MTEISQETIRQAVERHSDDILQWLMELVRFPSENRPPVGAEKGAQEWVAEECRKQGWNLDVFEPTEVHNIEDHQYWLVGRDYKDRPNVVATVPGQGEGKSILISGHVDVAPFEPDNWKVCRPYEPVIQDGKMYGRGTADMKAGLACGFWAIKILQELGFEPQGKIIFESLADEEFASGNGTLAARLRGHNANFALVTEPTRMRILPTCMGAFLGNMTIKGSAGMPYMGKAIANPIDGAAQVIDLFNQWKEKWRAENYHPMFDEPGSELNTLLWRMSSTKPDEFTQMGTPLFVMLSWIVWCHPGMTEEEFYRRFRAYWDEEIKKDELLQEFEITIERDYHYVRPWETPTDDPGFVTLLDSFRAYSGIDPIVAGGPYSADIAIYGDPGGMPVAYLGPTGGNLHGSDEWVDTKDVLDCTGIIATMVSQWCGY